MARHLPFILTAGIAISTIAETAFLPAEGRKSPFPLTRSLRLEAETSLLMGAATLARNQRPNGSWGSSPAITSLAVMAFTNAGPERQDLAIARRKALGFLAACQKETGAVSNARTRQYDVLTTALALQALTQKTEDSTTTQVAARALAYLLSQQLDNGGFPSGVGQPPNLAGTLFAVEAIYICRLQEIGSADLLDRAFQKAGEFILSCQESDPGGTFQSSPVDSFPKPEPPGMGVSPAFLTCTGIRGLLYTGTSPSSPRVLSALTWLNANFAFDKNPGFEQHGYYTYMLGLAKTLRVCEKAGVNFAPYPNLLDWRNEMARELMRRQQGAGRWITGNSDWWENSGDIVAANVMFALGNLLL